MRTGGTDGNLCTAGSHGINGAPPRHRQVLLLLSKYIGLLFLQMVAANNQSPPQYLFGVG